VIDFLHIWDVAAVHLCCEMDGIMLMHRHHHQIAYTAEVRCINPEWPRWRALDHSARILKGVPLAICWIHEWRGRPGRRRQPGPKRRPVLAAVCDLW